MIAIIIIIIESIVPFIFRYPNLSDLPHKKKSYSP